MSFKCDMCGECCRNLNMSDIYADLDSGDGTCRYLIGNLCSIYENRPLKCRIDDSYYAFFSNVMTKEDYYQRNYEVCKELKSRKQNNMKED